MLRPTRFFSVTLLVASFFMLSGCGEETAMPYGVTLDVWGTFDDSEVFSKMARDYQEINPYVKEIKYRKFAPETYKEDLLNAMAAGNGPDIFMIRNTWPTSFSDKVVPAPDTLFNEKIVRDAFVDVVADDFLNTEKKLLAAPLSVDSLALYYNKDLFNTSGISTPPKTWEELLALVPTLKRVDEFGNITQAAISLGTGENVNRASDVLLALMLQYGSPLSDASFSSTSDRQALEFYSQFARLGLPVYTWNLRQHYSIDAFYEGTLAMMINYSYHHQTIRQKNAKLNFATAPLPQRKDGTPVNFANYWGFAVAKTKNQVVDFSNTNPLPTDIYQKARLHEAWQFLAYLTLPHPSGKMTLSNALSGNTMTAPVTVDAAKQYLEMTKKPAARRDLISSQQSDVILSPFANGNLIAETWQPGNTEQAEGLLLDTISMVARGERSVDEALSVFETRYGQLYRR